MEISANFAFLTQEFPHVNCLISSSSSIDVILPLGDGGCTAEDGYLLLHRDAKLAVQRGRGLARVCGVPCTGETQAEGNARVPSDRERPQP